VHPLLGRPVLARVVAGREALELRRKLGRVGEQAGDMVPDGALQLLGFDVAAWASGRASTQDAMRAHGTASVVGPKVPVS
jgi:hypothetical protein